MISILFSTGLLFLSNLLDFVAIRRIVSHKNHQNWSTVISSVGALFITSLLAYFAVDNLLDSAYSILQDYRFYLSVVLESFALLLLRMNYHYNSGNLTAVKMGVFSSIFIVPLISVGFTDILGFQNTIVVHYHSYYELFGLVSGIAIIYYFLFKGRHSSHPVSHPVLLIALSVTVPFAIFMAVKNMQFFNAFLFFALISVFNIAIFSGLAIFKKEKVSLNSETLLDFKIIFFASIIVFAIFPYVASIISAEYFTILKRIFSIKIAVFFDAFDRKIKILEVLNYKDIFLVFLLIIMGIYFQYLSLD